MRVVRAIVLSSEQREILESRARDRSAAARSLDAPRSIIVRLHRKECAVLSEAWGRPSSFVVCRLRAARHSRRQKTIVCSTQHSRHSACRTTLGEMLHDDREMTVIWKTPS
jgi:hypothetical protein